MGLSDRSKQKKEGNSIAQGGPTGTILNLATRGAYWQKKTCENAQALNVVVLSVLLCLVENVLLLFMFATTQVTWFY